MKTLRTVDPPPAPAARPAACPKLDTPLNSLRALALLSFACILIVLVFPATQRFLAGGCASISGLLAMQLFRLKGVEEKPDPRDRDITVLGLGNS